MHPKTTLFAGLPLIILLAGCIKIFDGGGPRYTPYLSLNYNNRGRDIHLSIGEKFTGKVSRVVAKLASGDSIVVDSIFHCPSSKFCATDIVDSSIGISKIDFVVLRYTYGERKFVDTVGFGPINAFRNSLLLSRKAVSDTSLEYALNWESKNLVSCPNCIKIFQINLRKNIFLANSSSIKSEYIDEDGYIVSWGSFGIGDDGFRSMSTDTNNFSASVNVEAKDYGTHKVKYYIGKFMFDFEGNVID